MVFVDHDQIQLRVRNQIEIFHLNIHNLILLAGLSGDTKFHMQVNCNEVDEIINKVSVIDQSTNFFQTIIGF